MNTFMEGKLRVERKKKTTSCKQRGYDAFSLHLGFAHEEIRQTSQVFDFPVSGSHQKTNYPLVIVVHEADIAQS